MPLIVTGCYHQKEKMRLREQLITEAREWIGTPWQHHQCCKSYGVDCVGLFWGIAESCNVNIGSKINYYRNPISNSLQEELDKRFQPIPFADRAPGDCLLFRIGSVPRHVGMVSYDNHFIHASCQHGVIEVILDTRWRDRVVSCYQIF